MEIQNQTTISLVKKVEPLDSAISFQLPKEQIPDKEFKIEISEEKIDQKVQEVNEVLESVTTEVKFQLHEKLNTYYVQVINTKTDEVLREIPQKKFLDMYASMAEFAGILIDEKY